MTRAAAQETPSIHPRLLSRAREETVAARIRERSAQASGIICRDYAARDYCVCRGAPSDGSRSLDTTRVLFSVARLCSAERWAVFAAQYGLSIAGKIHSQSIEFYRAACFDHKAAAAPGGIT
jgi:hypothetical protein